jgi:hypothetical protein
MVLIRSGMLQPRRPGHFERLDQLIQMGRVGLEPTTDATVGVRQQVVDHRTLALASEQLHGRLLKPRAGHNVC